MGKLDGFPFCYVRALLNSCWAKFRGRNIAFHPATFYLSIADHLAREVDDVQSGPEPIEEDPWDASSERDDSER